MIRQSTFHNHSFQFIFSDGSRSQADESELEATGWEEIRIPDGAIIKRYELMQNQTNSCLHGVKFLDKRGKVLLAVGDIDEPNAR